MCAVETAPSERIPRYVRATSALVWWWCTSGYGRRDLVREVKPAFFFSRRHQIYYLYQVFVVATVSFQPHHHQYIIIKLSFQLPRPQVKAGKASRRRASS